MNAWENETFFWGWGEPFNKIVKLLLDNKGLLLSKRAANSFGGYAGAQLRRFQNALARDSMPDMEKGGGLCGVCKQKGDRGGLLMGSEKGADSVS